MAYKCELNLVTSQGENGKSGKNWHICSKKYVGLWLVDENTKRINL